MSDLSLGCIILALPLLGSSHLAFARIWIALLKLSFTCALPLLGFALLRFVALLGSSVMAKCRLDNGLPVAVGAACHIRWTHRRTVRTNNGQDPNCRDATCHIQWTYRRIDAWIFHWCFAGLFALMAVDATVALRAHGCGGRQSLDFGACILAFK